MQMCFVAEDKKFKGMAWAIKVDNPLDAAQDIENEILFNSWISRGAVIRHVEIKEGMSMIILWLYRKKDY